MNFSDMINQISGNTTINGSINITKDITGINVNKFKDMQGTSSNSTKQSNPDCIYYGNTPSMVIEKESKKDIGVFVEAGAVCTSIYNK